MNTLQQAGRQELTTQTCHQPLSPDGLSPLLTSISTKMWLSHKLVLSKSDTPGNTILYVLVTVFYYCLTLPVLLGLSGQNSSNFLEVWLSFPSLDTQFSHTLSFPLEGTFQKQCLIPYLVQGEEVLTSKATGTLESWRLLSLPLSHVFTCRQACSTFTARLPMWWMCWWRCLCHNPSSHLLLALQHSNQFPHCPFCFNTN